MEVDVFIDGFALRIFFVMVLYAFEANMAFFDAVSVENLVKMVVLGKCFSSRLFKKCLAIIVDIFSLKGELIQITFLLWLRLLCIFVLTALYFNFC